MGNGTIEELFESDRPCIALLVSLCIVLFFFNLGGRDLWAPDEGEYAQISQEMLDTGDWVIPRMNDQPTAQKPPLFNWAVAIISLPLGRVTEVTARLPSALGGLAGVLATYWLGKTLYGNRRTALFSALVLATTPIYFHQARWVQVDMLLCAFVTLSLSLFYYGYTNPTVGARCNVPLLLGSFCMGLGVLTKGPMAIILPSLTIALFLALQGQIKEFLNRRLILYLVAVFAVSIPWYLASYSRGGADFTRELILKHNFQMFLETWSHKQPIYYYLWNLPWEFSPWVVFLPAAVYQLLLNGRERPQRDFLLAWAVVMFCFFSLSQAKQAKYLLPMMPALALMVGRFWEGVLVQDAECGVRFSYKRWVLIPGGVMSGCMLLTGVLGLWFIKKRYPEYLSLFVPLSSFLTLLGGSFFLGLLYGGREGHFRQRWTAFISLLVGLSLLLFYYHAFIQKELNPHNSARPFCQEAVRIVKERPLGIFGIGYHQIGPYLFYTKRRLKTFSDQGSLEEFLGSPASGGSEKERMFCIIGDAQLAALKGASKAPVYNLLSAVVGHRRIHLISNRPG
ncbi:MAG: glycosyltransferase family 39 protein [Planctomycetes bacterium]|nr:glycosyltransferase family 39 protein [Planctomycetota bacterium]